MRNNRMIPYNQNVSVSGYNENVQNISLILSAFSIVGLAAGAYHGYKRNDSVGWAIWWGFCGSVVPVFTVAVAAAQGFGKPTTA